MAHILCIIDGMSDCFFHVSKYPALASFRETGFVKTVPDGHSPETLPCVLTLLGIIPPRNIRGWIEALGADVAIDENDLIFRGSWMRLDEHGIYIDFFDAPVDVTALRYARYVPLGGYRSLFILPGYSAYANVIKMKPPYELFGTHPNKLTATGIELLDSDLSLVNASQSGRALALWNPSSMKTLPVFPQKAAAVCGTNVVKGIAKALGMRLITSESMTGDIDTDLHKKVAATLTMADEYPFVMLHIGGCDESAHRKNKIEKELFLKRIDETVITELLLSKHDIAISSDHGCDPSTGRHTGEHQPYFKRPGKS